MIKPRSILCLWLHVWPGLHILRRENLLHFRWPDRCPFLVQTTKFHSRIELGMNKHKCSLYVRHEHTHIHREARSSDISPLLPEKMLFQSGVRKMRSYKVGILFSLFVFKFDNKYNIHSICGIFLKGRGEA